MADRDFIDDWFGERKPAEPAERHGRMAEPSATDDHKTAVPVAPSTAEYGMPAEAQPAPMTILDHALAMAARGFRCFPLRDGSKRPRVTSWPEQATTDPAKIRSWFETWPNGNYGVAAGEGVLILDVDAGKNGYAALLDLDLPPTFTVKTPGGGEHQYFSGPDVANSVDRIGDGLDTRSDRGYVVGPGSYFADNEPGKKKGYTGIYTVAQDMPPARAPESLVLLAGTPPERRSRKPPACEPDLTENVDWAIPNYLAREPDDGGAPIAIEGKGGNQTTYQVFARLRELGISAEKSVELAEEHWNARCQPPWSHSELVVLAANADQYGENAFGERAPTVEAERFGEAVTIEPSPAIVAPAAPLRGEWIDFDTPLIPVQWLVKGLFPVEGAGFITGLPNAGKSALAFDLADALARREEWFGHRIRRRSGTIVLAFEGGRAHTLLRLRALLAGRTDAPPAISVRYLDGLTKNDLPQLPLMIRERARQIEERYGFPVRLLVIDTLGASGLLDDENDNAEIQRVFAALRGLGRAVGMFVLVVHHPTKSQSDDLSGGGALRRTADIVVRASYEEGKPVRELRVVKTREGVTGPLGAYSVRGVVAGTDEDGEPATAVVIERVRTVQAGPSLAQRLRGRIETGPDGPGTHWRKSNQSEHAIDRAFADELGYRYEISGGRLKMDRPNERKHVAEIVREWLAKRWLVEFETTDLRGERRMYVRLGKADADAAGFSGSATL